MKKLMTAVLLVCSMMSVAVTPAQADPGSAAIVLGLLVIGPHVAGDLVRSGKLPGPPAACKTENVQAENGNYFYRRVIDDGKGCTFSG